MCISTHITNTAALSGDWTETTTHAGFRQLFHFRYLCIGDEIVEDNDPGVEVHDLFPEGVDVEHGVVASVLTCQLVSMFINLHGKMVHVRHAIYQQSNR